MPPRDLQLGLDGEVSIEELQRLVASLAGMVTELAASTEHGDVVRWVVSTLKGGSAYVGVSGRAETSVGREAVATIGREWDTVWRDARRGDLHRHSFRMREHIASISMLAAKSGHALKIPLDGEVLVIAEHVDTGPSFIESVRSRQTFRTSVKGEVVALSRKQAPYFTLRESGSDRMIRCYPQATVAARRAMAKAWTEATCVLVEGTFNTITEHPTLTEISDIIDLGRGEPGGWRSAFGIAPRAKGREHIEASDAVRKLRDA